MPPIFDRRGRDPDVLSAQILVEERLHSIVRGGAEIAVPASFDGDEMTRHAGLPQRRVQPDGRILDAVGRKIARKMQDLSPHMNR